MTTTTPRTIDPCPRCGATVTDVESTPNDQHPHTAQPCGHGVRVTTWPDRIQLDWTSGADIDLTLADRPYDHDDPFCEFCNRTTHRDGLTITYAYEGDEWCADCLLGMGYSRAAAPGVTRESLAAAGPRPADPSYLVPFVWTTADGRIRNGEQVHP